MATAHGEIEFIIGTQNISGNYTPVTVNFYAVRDSGYVYSGYATYPELTLDGKTETKTLSSYDLSSSNTKVLLGSITKNVAHNADGKKTVAASFTWNPENSNLSTVKGSASKTLATIPRTSEVSLSDKNFNIGESITINTNRASTSFTHTAVIKFNGSTVRTQKSIGASYKWDTSELYEYIPKANKATGTVVLTTYSGSTEIGSSEISFTANVTKSNPTFSNCTYEDTGKVSTDLTGNNQTLISGYNALKVTISTANKAVAKNRAKMSKYRLVCGNQSVEEPYKEDSEVILKLNYVTSMTFIVYAIDSRGNSTPVTKSVTTWKDHFAPSITVGVAERTEQVNEATQLTFSGKIWNGNFGAEQNEIKSCIYRYKKTSETEDKYITGTTTITPTISGNTFSASLLIEGDSEANGFNVSNSYNIQLTLKDRIRATMYNITLSAGIPAIAIHPNGVSIRRSI